jgi:cell division protein FtsQ
MGIIFLMGFTHMNHQERTCSSVDIQIDYGKREHASEVMLVRNDIEHVIGLNFEKLKGKKLEEINIEEIKKVIGANNYVKNIDVHQQLDGKIQIKLTQRRPILRVFGKSGKNFYIDESGYIVPIKSGYPARVIIASGNIYDEFFNNQSIDLMTSSSDSLPGVIKLRNLYFMAKFLDKDSFLRREITQIDIALDNKIILIPLVGQHIIEMNSFSDYAKKLIKLKIFYTQTINQGGWSRYSKINIEYKNQIVCTKI